MFSNKRLRCKRDEINKKHVGLQTNKHKINLLFLASAIINNLLQGTLKSYWIGLSDIETEGVWKYVDGVVATPENSNFGKGEPNTNGGDPNSDCGQLYVGQSYTMDDVNCSLQQLAVCERI